MKQYLLIGIVSLCLVSCIRESHWEKDCREDLFFRMEEVPYILDGSDVVDYRPYYTFTENLHLFVFSGERLTEMLSHDYAYCREHLLIPYKVDPGRYSFLFVANLYDQEELSWKFENGQLEAVFSIRDHEEPPVFLVFSNDITIRRADTVPVQLRMLVSRLEIQVENPPAWVTGLDISLSNVAGSVTSDFVLGDTAYIRKQVSLDTQGESTYRTGVNTFPTYPDLPALLNIQLIGTQAIAPIVVEDSRLHLIPGNITQIDIVFQSDGQLKISIEINGKWEVIDGGHIII